jgi:hypothetical protein
MTRVRSIAWLVWLGACSSSGGKGSDDAAASVVFDAGPATAVTAVADAGVITDGGLDAAARRKVRAALRGEWVNHSGLESKRWTFRGDTLIERVTRRGDKRHRGRVRTLKITLPARNRMVVRDGDRHTTYNILVRKKVLYASSTYGIFPMLGARHFVVKDTAGNRLEYDKGRCTVTAPGGKPQPSRCLYSVSYYHKVLTFRYRNPLTKQPVITVFHGDGGFLLHETVISCCKFNLTRR